MIYASVVKKQPNKTTEVVGELLKKVEQTLKEGDVKATLAEYIRLVQLQKELEEDEPKEITVTWVEPTETKSEDET